MEDEQKRYKWETGTGDGTDQPIVHGKRIPPADEMKKGPIFGAPIMMAPGETYKQAVKNWATYICNNGKADSGGFCEWSYTVGNEKADGWDALWVIIGAAGLAAGGGGGGVAATSATKTGRLTLIGARFSQSERAVAEHLAGQGKNVVLRQATGIGRTSDLLVNRVMYDVYTPLAGTSVTNILGRTAKKHSQVKGGGVVIDLTGTGLKSADFGNALARVNGMVKSWGGTPLSDVTFFGG